MYDRKSSISKILQNEEDFIKAWGTRKPKFFHLVITDFGDKWFGFSPSNLAKGLRMHESEIPTEKLIKHMFREMYNINKKIGGKKPEKKVTIVIAGDRSTKASRPKSHIKHSRKETRKRSIKKKGKILNWDGKSPLLSWGRPVPDWESINADSKAMSRARDDCVALMLLMKDLILPGFRIMIDVPCNMEIEEYRKLFVGVNGANIDFPKEKFKFPCIMEHNDATGKVEVHHIPELEHAHAEADHSFQWFINQMIENDIYLNEDGKYVLRERSEEEQKKMRVKVKSKDIDNLCLSAISEEQRFYEMNVYSDLRHTRKAKGTASRKGKKNVDDGFLYEEDVPQRIYVDHSVNGKTKICNITKLSLIVRRRFLQNDEIRKSYEREEPKAMAIVDNPMRNLMGALYAAGSDWVEGCKWIKTERFFKAFMEMPTHIGPIYDPSLLNNKLAQTPTMEEESVTETVEPISELTLTESDQASIRTLRKFHPDVVSGMSFEAYTRLLYFATLKAVYPKKKIEEMSFSDILKKNCYNPTVEEAFGRYMRVCYYYIMALYCHFIRIPIFDNYEDFCWKEEMVEGGYRVAKPCPMKGVKNGRHMFWGFAARRK